MGHNLSTVLDGGASIVQTSGNECPESQSSSDVVKRLKKTLLMNPNNESTMKNDKQLVRMMGKVRNQLNCPSMRIFKVFQTKNIISRLKINNVNDCKNNNDCKNLKLISSQHLAMLDCEWKFSLYITLTDCDLIYNLGIPFEILYIIVNNCQGTIRNCDICNNELLDLRFTKGYKNKKLTKKEMKPFRFVLCYFCHKKVMESYEKVDKNLESMGMRGV